MAATTAKMSLNLGPNEQPLEPVPQPKRPQVVKQAAPKVVWCAIQPQPSVKPQDPSTKPVSKIPQKNLPWPKLPKLQINGGGSNH